MPVAVYGHFGTPVLFFPTASADFEELERFQMISALAHHINAGRVKIFAPNSINSHSWFNYDIHPGERVWRQALYDRYVVDELVPFIHHHCRTWDVPILTAGASMGAYHAANTLFRHPTIFRGCICMSGFYNVARYHHGFFNDHCYFQNPICYLPNLHDGFVRWHLDSCSINILCGRGPWERVEWSDELHDVLNQAGIPHNYDLWGHDVAHDWEWWRKQMDHYLWKLLG
ncbi:MAG: esterase [Armatimonadetes bacterium]|nr:esterase [Armatimonadota bacterium]